MSAVLPNEIQQFHALRVIWFKIQNHAPLDDSLAVLLNLFISVTQFQMQGRRSRIFSNRFDQVFDVLSQFSSLIILLGYLLISIDQS